MRFVPCLFSPRLSVFLFSVSYIAALRYVSFHVSICRLLHAETCPFVVRKGSFYKLTAWCKIARCAVYAVLIPYKHSRSRPYYVFRLSVQLLSSVVCCRSKCTRISRWRMPKMFRQKLITRHIPVYCADCQCVMVWWVACLTRHLRVSLPLVWRVAVSTRHIVTACPSECYASVWRVTSFFRKSFCVVLSLTFPEFGSSSSI